MATVKDLSTNNSTTIHIITTGGWSWLFKTSEFKSTC